MYLDYWELTKHPFNNLPDPEMYFDMHQSVDTAVKEILFAVDEGSETLAVVVGPVGAGKTMALRMILDSIDAEKFKIAFVTNPDMTFPQLLREIIGQIECKACEDRTKDALLEKFNRVIHSVNKSGKRVLIFIDEGNMIKPHNLESLRMLTNMQDNTQNLFTIVLAGQPELSKRIEDPRKANLFQRIGVYCKIQGIDSATTMRAYINYRLDRAGNKPERVIFTDGAIAALWSISDHGTPRIINNICKLSLKAAATSQLKMIDEKVISTVGARFLKSYSIQKGKTNALKPEIQTLEDHPFNEKARELIQKYNKEMASVPADTESIKPQEDLHSSIAKVSIEVDKKNQNIETERASAPQEIAPTDEDIEKSDSDAGNGKRLANKQKPLSSKEIEELASRLATQRVNTMKVVSDPFEAWEKARADILQQITKPKTSPSIKEV